MATQTVAPATGSIPQQSSDLLSQNANSIVHIPYGGSNGPQRMDVNINGVGNVAGYTATSVAIVEHYDPFAHAIVRDSLRGAVSAWTAPNTKDALR